MKWLNINLRSVPVLLLVGLLIRGAIAYWLPAGYDEAYYYQYVRHLDWSYFDHPVLVALTTGLGPWLTGIISPWSIRLGSVLLYTGSLWWLYRTGIFLFSVKAGHLALAIASLVPIFFIGFGVLTLPDSPLIFFWTIALFVASQEFFASQDYRPTGRLALLGGLVGLACLGKYHGAALGIGLLGFCLTSARHRSALRSPWMLLSGLLFGLAIAPILIWNVQHDWISLRFQSGRAFPDRGYSGLDLLVTFLVSTAYLFPSLGFPLWWATGRSLWQALHPPSSLARIQLTEKYRLILWLSLPLMLGFTLMGGYRPILPTWAMPGCWGATLLLADLATHWRWVNRWLVLSGGTIASLILIVLLHLNLGVLQTPSQYAWFGGLIPASQDGSVQLLDIEQLRQGLQRSPEIAQALTQSAFLFTDEIFLAGQVGMAIAPLTDQPITCLNQDLRGFAFWSKPDQWVGRTGLYFTSEQRLPNRVDHYRSYFTRMDKVADIPLQRGGVTVEVIQVYRGQSLLRPYPRPYGLL